MATGPIMRRLETGASGAGTVELLRELVSLGNAENQPADSIGFKRMIDDR